MTFLNTAESRAMRGVIGDSRTLDGRLTLRCQDSAHDVGLS